ncbi:MAG: HlyD family efflux transporter periplasmic adaptor subunit, partial [Pseudomonadota bacterium]
EGMVRALSAEEGLDKPATFALPAYADPAAEQTTSYSFRHFLWVPLFSRKGALFGGMLMSRERPWPAPSLVLAERLAQAYSYAFASFQGRRLEKPRSGLWTTVKLAATVGIIAAAFIPVPLTVLAPVEIAGRDAPVVAAPLDGVVADILVRPDAPVAEGQVVARLDDTELRNALEIATQNVAVAEVSLEQSRQTAFVDYSAAGEVAVAEAELELARAERSLAAERLARVEMTAPSAGRVVIEDPRDWIGRPVAVGERVMAIADPDRIEARIELFTGDAIALEAGARVRIFLDTDPLNPLDAQLSDLAYAAEPTPDGSLAFTLKAQLDEDAALPRIGARGTAQIFGETHPLWFVVFRRPIASVRQAFGI